jgi:hypothetical protein
VQANARCGELGGQRDGRRGKSETAYALTKEDGVIEARGAYFSDDATHLITGSPAWGSHEIHYVLVR